MANTITKAVEYVNNEQEVLRMYKVYSLFADLIKAPLQHTGATISYDQTSFSSYTQGTYDRENGYTNKPFTFSRETKTLSQDMGDSLQLDKMDKEEAQIADGIVHIFNVYNVKVAIPSFDSYIAGVLTATTTGVTQTTGGAVTTSNVLSLLLADKATIENKRIRFEECIIYIRNSVLALLDEACFSKGFITLGNWNGRMDALVKLFQGAKIVAVPDSVLGTNNNWVIVHPLSFDVYEVYKEVVYFDRIPGYGGRMAELDVGNYYDAWFQPGGEDGCVQNVVA